MTRPILLRTAAALTTLLLLTAPAVQASERLDAATDARVRAELTAQGHDVRKIEKEDGLIEVYAVKDGKKWELYLDADLKIVRTKAD